MGQQAETRLGLGAALLESGCVDRPRLGQAGAGEGEVDELLAQILLRAEGHVLHRHLGQARQIFLEIFELFLELQLEQAQQPVGMRFPRFFRRVEDAQRNGITVIRQAGIANDHLADAHIHFHEFRQLAEAPVGHAGVLGRRFVQFRELLLGLDRPTCRAVRQGYGSRPVAARVHRRAES